MVLQSTFFNCLSTCCRNTQTKMAAVLLAVVCCFVFSAHAQSDIDAGITGQTVTVPLVTTEAPITEFSIELYHRESTTSSVSIVWRPLIPEGIKITKYRIETNKQDSESVTTSPELPADTTEYIVEDLIKDSKWKICVVASISNDTFSQDEEHFKCLDSFTIPYIRDDSLYVLAITVAVIGSLVLIGYLSWRCAVQEAEKRAAEAEAEEEEDENDEGKLIKPVQAKPILLSPVDNSPDRPKSSIEDEDIPYITPPLE